MKINSGFRDLLQSLNEGGVRYLIVGGYAVMVYTEPRYTKDLDLWVEPTADNAADDRRAGRIRGSHQARGFVEPDVFFQSEWNRVLS